MAMLLDLTAFNYRGRPYRLGLGFAQRCSGFRDGQFDLV